MRGLEGVFTALLLGPTAVWAIDALASSVLFTTIKINTAICTTTTAANSSTTSTSNSNGGGNNSSSGHNGVVDTKYGSYKLLGFYPIPQQGSVLKRTVSNSLVSNSMTLELCGDFCQGSAFFAVEYGTTCLCAVNGPAGTPEQDVATTTPCAGDKTEVCGAPGHAVVYENERIIAPSSSSGSNGGSEIVVTGVTTDSLGTHTFVSTEVVSSNPTGPSTILVTDVTTDSLETHTFVSTEVVSGSSNPAGPSTVVVTGVTTDSLGTHTFTSTEVVSSFVTATATSGGAFSSNGAESSDNGGASSSAAPGVSSSDAGVSSSATGVSSSDAGVSSSDAGVSSSDTDVSSTAAGVSSSDAGVSSSDAGVSSTAAGASSSTAEASSSTAGASSSTESATSASTDSGTSTDTSMSVLPSSSAAYPCPQSDGQTVAIGGGSYVIQCNTNYEFMDLIKSPAESLTECLQLCTDYQPSSGVAFGAPCEAATFGVGNVRECYLKYAVETVQEGQDGYDSGYLASYQPVNASTTGQTATATTTSTSSGTTGSSSTVTTGSTSTATTGSTSTATTGSTSSSSTGSSSSSSTSTATTGSSSTSTGSSSTSSTSAEPTDATTPVCPTNNNTVYVDTFAYAYYVKCGLDITGTNFANAHADTFTACVEYCDLAVGCAAVTYATPGNRGDPNCYAYNVFTGYSQTSTTPTDLLSGVPQNGTSTGYPDAMNDYCANGQNQTIQTDPLGRNYFIGCDLNLPGTPSGSDLHPMYMPDLDSCMTYCSLYDTCVAVDWIPENANAPYNPNCYPKFDNGAAQKQPGTQCAQYQA